MLQTKGGGSRKRFRRNGKDQLKGGNVTKGGKREREDAVRVLREDLPLERRMSQRLKREGGGGNQSWQLKAFLKKRVLEGKKRPH